MDREKRREQWRNFARKKRVEHPEEVSEYKKKQYLIHREHILEKEKTRYREKRKAPSFVEDLDGEIWRVVFEKYSVSNMCRVKTINHINKFGLETGEKLLSIYLKKGCKFTTINRRPMRLSVLVSIGFPEICGKRFEGCEVHHIDHDKLNDVPENLLVLSQEEHKKYHSNSEYTYVKRSNSQIMSWKKRKTLNAGI